MNLLKNIKQSSHVDSMIDMMDGLSYFLISESTNKPNRQGVQSNACRMQKHIYNIKVTIVCLRTFVAEITLH